MKNPNNEPLRVRLTEDWLDLLCGHGYPAGTVLIRSPHGSGQYFPEGTPLGAACVTMFSLIAEISETIEPYEPTPP